MKPIIRWGLWDRRWSMFGWSVGISFYIAVNVLVYGSIRDQAQMLNKVLDSLSPTAKGLFGGGNDFLSPVGYLNSKLYYLILPLLFIMLSIGLVSSLLTREEQSGTLELLLSRPVSRGRLLAAKLFTALLVVLVVGLVALVVTMACAQAVHFDIAFSRLALATGLTILLSLLFSSVAWALVGVGRAGRALSIGGAGVIALASYLFSSLEASASWMHWPAKLLPYHYYQPSEVLSGTYNWLNALGMVIATAVLLAIAFLGFRRRDIR